MGTALRYVGMSLAIFGLGSFILPLIGGDSWLFQKLGKGRPFIMALSCMVGAGMFAGSYAIKPGPKSNPYLEEEEDDEDEE